MLIIGAYQIVGTAVLDYPTESGGNQLFKRGFINIGVILIGFTFNITLSLTPIHNSIISLNKSNTEREN